MCLERRLARHDDMVTQRRVTMPPGAENAGARN